MPKSNFGPVELIFSYRFKLINLDTKNELENQEHTSILPVWLSRGKSCSPTIFLPLKMLTKNFGIILILYQSFFLSNLKKKYLRLGHVNKQGDIKSFKKIGRTITIIP